MKIKYRNGHSEVHQVRIPNDNDKQVVEGLSDEQVEMLLKLKGPDVQALKETDKPLLTQLQSTLCSLLRVYEIKPTLTQLQFILAPVRWH